MERNDGGRVSGTGSGIEPLLGVCVGDFLRDCQGGLEAYAVVSKALFRATSVIALPLELASSLEGNVVCALDDSEGTNDRRRSSCNPSREFHGPMKSG